MLKNWILTQNGSAINLDHCDRIIFKTYANDPKIHLLVYLAGETTESFLLDSFSSQKDADQFLYELLFDPAL